MRPFHAYHAQLDRVSRSFALCIPQLDAPLREQVALAYLLLRILDTIEDAPFTDRARQQAQFARFRGFLRARPTSFAALVRDMPADLPDGEAALLREADWLFDDAYALPAPVRAAMFSAIDRMAIGMAAYASRPSMRLVDGEDVTRYCCFVAGLVGEMLGELWAIASGKPAPSPLLAYQFGLFLQKVNILKDQPEDEAQGRFLLPDRGEVLASLRVHAQGALAYLQSLPQAERGYRTFCAWSLMMGAATIAGPKLPRAQTLALLEQTARVVTDNAALASLFGSLMPRLPERAAPIVRDKPESTAWFVASLAAPLSDDELAWLGIGARRLAS